MSDTIQTTCPYCGVGCGISATVDKTHSHVTIAGDKNHPANFGRLCSKGFALAETLEVNGRLLQPQLFGQTSTWSNALDWVAQAFLKVIEQHGPEAVALYGSGQLLTEDYYVANKLMKGFIGSGNMDTNSRLCMSSSVAGHKRAFGADTVPGCYADVELADMIVFIGSNAAWCHPVIFQRIRAAKEARPALKIVVIDPRKTASCAIADLHLPLAAGSDTLLFNGLLAYLADHDAVDSAYIDQQTEGFSAALNSALATTQSTEHVAAQCQINSEDLQQFYQWFAQTNKTMSLYSQGVNQSTSGTDKVNAIINCHLATGRIGQPGMGPFSLTGQPNAMGGREVGGLSHQLAAHMDFSKPDDIQRVAQFWSSDRIAQQPGLPAVELFDAIYDGRIKAVWIMGTNPVVSLPNADKVKQALQRCELVIVSDCIAHTDTTALAHVLLPAQAWSEKTGTVTNSERRISRQRRLLTPAGEAMPDWWIISQVAQRMGFEQAFAYQTAADIFREHAALSGYENNGTRDFDISAFADMSDTDYEQLVPIQWPVNASHPHGKARFFTDGKFYTPSGKAQFIAITPKPAHHQPDATYPLILNTGRLRDQWHTMTRTAIAAKLNQHKPEPFVEIHPQDAKQYHLTHNGLAHINSRWGAMLARVQITDTQKRGNLFVPMHWTAQYASHGRMGSLVNPAVDALSKQPESKYTPVHISPYQPQWVGFILSRKALSLNHKDYWVKIKGEQFYRYELAGHDLPEHWPSWAQQQLGRLSSTPCLEYQDYHLGNYRTAQVIKQRLESVLFISRQKDLPERTWLSGLFSKPQLDDDEHRALLTGCPPLGKVDVGTMVCACFRVGEKTLVNAIKEQGLTTAAAVGQCLKAGTNCGSCVPEINVLLKRTLSVKTLP